MSRIAKLSRLFEEGRPVVLMNSDGERMTFWVNKLSPFEAEQANQEGRVARSRKMLAVREVGTPEYTLFQASLGAASREAIVETLVEARNGQHLLKALQAIRTDPAWSEKVEVLEQTDTDARMSDDETALLVKIATSYAQETEARIKTLDDEYRRELKQQNPQELEQLALDEYLEKQGGLAFSTAQRRWQLYFALRECVAEPPNGDQAWDHSRCNHRERSLTDVAELDGLPETVLSPIVDALQDVMVPPDVARFTGALASSSGSSESSPSAGDSVASGPTETSTEPATTSS